MNINKLIAIVKKKLEDEIVIEKIDIEDKTYLHKNHSGYQDGKFHLKLKSSSIELKKLNPIDSNRRFFKILDEEVKEYIHSLQILIN